MSENKLSDIVIFGEILFDCFPDGSRRLGGAPFNVAWHLRGLGHDPLLISRVGHDDAGQEVLRRLREWGLETRGIQVDPGRPTGTVTVSLRDGKPEFTIAPRQAYDAIDPAQALAAVGDRKKPVLYHGTLALREEGNARVLAAVAAATSPSIFLDVNVRRPWWNPEVFSVLARRASWLKASVEELSALDLPADDPAAAARLLVQRHALAAAVITGGEQGAWHADPTGSVHVPAVPIADVVDTVGAGDAFSAVCIHGLLARWSPTTMLSRAAAFAAEICRRPGAVTDDRELYARLQGGWRRWERPQHTG